MILLYFDLQIHYFSAIYFKKNLDEDQDLSEFIRMEFEQPELKSWPTEFTNKVLHSVAQISAIFRTSAFWQQKMVSNLQHL